MSTEIALEQILFNFTNYEFENVVKTHKNSIAFSNNNYQFEVPTQNNIFNFTNSIYSLEVTYKQNNFNIQNSPIVLEYRSFNSFTFGSTTAVQKNYSMRARKVSDNSFIYWRTIAIDSNGAQSGFNSNEIYDICVLGYN